MFSTDEPELLISSINFAPDEINIQYMERRNQSKHAYKAESLTIAVNQIEDEVEALVESLEALIDKGLLLLRNPSKQIHKRQPEASAEDVIEFQVEVD